MKRLAEPKDMLAKRYQQFQRRLARHYINTIDVGQEGEEIGGSTEGLNITSNRINGNITSNFNSNVIQNQGLGSVNENRNRENNGGNGERKVFGVLSIPTTTSATALSTQSLSRDMDRRQPSTQSSTVRDTAHVRSSVPISASRPVPASNATFQILADTVTESTDNCVLTENENWRNLGTQSDKRKENNGRFCDALISLSF